MNAEKWTRASLRIFGENLVPDDISSSLNLAPTQTHLRGQRKSEKVPLVWKHSMWLLQSPLGTNEELPRHLEWLLGELEPRATTLKELSTQFKVDLFCGFSSENGQGGFTLSAELLCRLANLGIPIALDLYPPQAGETGGAVE